MRQKYNFEQTISRFAANTRNEVMFEPFAAALLVKVEETFHPEGIGLWLTSGKK